MAVNIEISDLFREKRKALGLSLRQVEARTGVSPQVISNIENNKGLPDTTNLVKLMVFYKVSAEEILFKG